MERSFKDKTQDTGRAAHEQNYLGFTCDMVSLCRCDFKKENELCLIYRIWRS